MSSLVKCKWLFILTFVVPSLIWAQQKQKATYIKGSINFDDQYEAILIPMVKTPTGEENNITVSISKTGKFTIPVNISKPDFYKFTIIPKVKNRQLAINFPMYLVPGTTSNLQLHYDDETYLTLKSNLLSNENKAMIAYSNFRFLKMKSWFLQPPSALQFQSVLHQYFDTAQALVCKYKLRNTQVKNYLQVWSMNDYLDNLIAHAANNDSIKVGPSFFENTPSPLKVYSLPEALFFYDTYRSIKAYLKIINPNPGFLSSNFAGLEQRIAYVQKHFSSTDIKSIFIYNELSEYTRQFRLNDQVNFEDEKKQFNLIAFQLKNEIQREKLIQNFANLQFTMMGAEMPPVQFIDLNGNKVSLQNFKGKNVYIDMWASWCIPCIAEVPHLKKLEADYKDKNIVFLSISTDEDKIAWKNKVKELNLHGNQLEIGDSGYEKMMNIQGIPHFILYGADGKLLNYKAPRPSTEAIRTIFNTLN